VKYGLPRSISKTAIERVWHFPSRNSASTI
jgi:hypothetical protein